MLQNPNIRTEYIRYSVTKGQMFTRSQQLLGLLVQDDNLCLLFDKLFDKSRDRLGERVVPATRDTPQATKRHRQLIRFCVGCC